MSLNDPFGRLKRRDEAGYEAVKAALVRAGVRDRDAAQRVIARTRTRVLLFIGGVCAALLPALVLWPRLAPVLVAGALLLMAVAVDSLVKGRRHVRRYIDEEVADRSLSGSRSCEQGPFRRSSPDAKVPPAGL